MHDEKKIIIVLLAGFLITLAIVAAVFVQQRTATALPGTPAPVAMPQSPDGLMHTLSGQVTAVSAGTLTLQAVLPGKTTATTVTVTPASGATITLQTQKDPAVLAKEMAAYQKQLASTSAAYGSVPPPLPVSSKTIALSDIQARMFITVTPVANTKQDATSISAQSISAYNPQAPLPPPPQPASIPPTSQAAH